MPSVYIKNVSSGLVLTIKDANEGQRGEIIMSPLEKEKHQMWSYKDGMFYSKLNKTLVLDVDEQNKKIITWPAHGGPNQKWTVGDDGVITSETGVVLDVFGGSTDAGTGVIPFAKHGGPNQVFKLKKKT